MGALVAIIEYMDSNLAGGLDKTLGLHPEMKPALAADDARQPEQREGEQGHQQQHGQGGKQSAQGVASHGKAEQGDVGSGETCSAAPHTVAAGRRSTRMRPAGNRPRGRAGQSSQTPHMRGMR